jgi:hypothetical protein
MAEATNKSVEIVAGGGFQIEIQDDKLTVSPDRKAYSKNEKKRLWMMFLLYVVFGLIPSISFFTDMEFPRSLSALLRAPGLLFAWPPNQQSLRMLVSLLCLATFIAVFLFASRRSITNIRCTPDVLEVLFVFRGRVRRTVSFERSEVKKIQYDDGLPSMFQGPSGCLIFQARDQKIRCLHGLKSVEAQRLLTELQRMRFDTVRDPGMPMMNEMEQSRRKRPFALFP